MPGLHKLLEAAGLDLHPVMADRQDREFVVSAPGGIRLRLVRVSCQMAVTFALATTAPDGSMTVPRIVPVVCPKTVTPKDKRNARIPTAPRSVEDFITGSFGQLHGTIQESSRLEFDRSEVA
jgi:hypothetical protein